MFSKGFGENWEILPSAKSIPVQKLMEDKKFAKMIMVPEVSSFFMLKIFIYNINTKKILIKKIFMFLYFSL